MDENLSDDPTPVTPDVAVDPALEPAPAPEPVDDGKIDLAFGDVTYRVAANMLDLDGDYADALLREPNADWGKACRALLGDQWATFKATRPTVGDYQKLVLAYGDVLGLNRGE